MIRRFLRRFGKKFEAAKFMKAVRIHKFGGPEVLQYEEIPVPTINSDEILIRVHAASVNPIDWKIRQGYRKPRTLPLTLGCDAAGKISKVGNNITTYKPGDTVFAFVSLARPGAYAEYLVAKENEVAYKPKKLDYTKAAAIPLAALTAWQVLFDVANLTAKQIILIHAAAGGVGHFAVQLAKWKGATVIGTGSEFNRQFLLDLGVDRFIDYKKEKFEEHVREIDVVFDTVGGETQERSWQLLKKGGILVTIVDPSQIEKNAETYGVRGLHHLVSPNAAELKQIADLIDQNKLHPHIAATFPLSAAKQAHEMSQKGHARGKIVLTVTK
jgi:NADPH:quinone reductase-like Zn-dependent oxidoreductase